LDGLEIHALEVHLPERGQIAKLLHLVDDELDDMVHLFLGIETAEAEADRRVRQLLADAEGAEDVARLERGRSAGRARRDGDVLERHHEPLALDEGEGNVEIPRQPMLERAVDEDLVEATLDAVEELVPKAQEPLALLGHLEAGELRRLAEADDARHVERSRAHAALVAAAVDDRGDADARLGGPPPRAPPPPPPRLFGPERRPGPPRVPPRGRALSP